MLMSVVGSQMWVTRSCRPTTSYRVNALQDILKKAKVSDLPEANKLTKYINETATRGLR